MGMSNLRYRFRNMEEIAEELSESSMPILTCITDENSGEIMAFESNSIDPYAIHSQEFQSKKGVPGESSEDKFSRIIDELRFIEAEINLKINTV